MVCSLEAKKAVAQARLTSQSVDKQSFTKNTFKCGKCMRVYHPQGSPLVLCDSCPKAYHVECLGIPFEKLPEGEWVCVKCQERHEANLQKLQDLETKKKEALERVATVRVHVAVCSAEYHAPFQAIRSCRLARNCLIIICFPGRGATMCNGCCWKLKEDVRGLRHSGRTGYANVLCASAG
jgi:hypothetical protein